MFRDPTSEFSHQTFHPDDSVSVEFGKEVKQTLNVGDFVTGSGLEIEKEVQPRQRGPS